MTDPIRALRPTHSASGWTASIIAPGEIRIAFALGTTRKLAMQNAKLIAAALNRQSERLGIE